MSLDDGTAPEVVDLLRRCDAYLDAAPREYSEVVDAGPLRVFVSRAPWPYYVRPRAELDLVQLARASALLAGRDYVIPEDVKSLAGNAMAK